MAWCGGKSEFSLQSERKREKECRCSARGKRARVSCSCESSGSLPLRLVFVGRPRGVGVLVSAWRSPAARPTRAATRTTNRRSTTTRTGSHALRLQSFLRVSDGESASRVRSAAERAARREEKKAASGASAALARTESHARRLVRRLLPPCSYARVSPVSPAGGQQRQHVPTPAGSSRKEQRRSRRRRGNQHRRGRGNKEGRCNQMERRVNHRRVEQYSA